MSHERDGSDGQSPSWGPLVSGYPCAFGAAAAFALVAAVISLALPSLSHKAS
ncbi:hypothetical protein [Actinomadura nitritigenes]|uniref:hypothetical protein n=1 Tax=Actinomadura nitritigenes TaxID=134602 RepID=UPI003D8DE315